jgi:hypothetical protein
MEVRFGRASGRGRCRQRCLNGTRRHWPRHGETPGPVGIRRLLSLSTRSNSGRSKVAIPKRTDPHTVVGTATVATPYAAGTALAVPVVTMPASAAALTGAVVAVNPDNVAAQAIRQLANIRRGGSCHRSDRNQKSRRSQGLDHSHIEPPGSLCERPPSGHVNATVYGQVPARNGIPEPSH